MEEEAERNETKHCCVLFTTDDRLLAASAQDTVLFTGQVADCGCWRCTRCSLLVARCFVARYSLLTLYALGPASLNDIHPDDYKVEPTHQVVTSA